MKSIYSPHFEDIQQAHDWAEANYPNTEETFFLIFDNASSTYQFVNDLRLNYLIEHWDTDVLMVGTWE